VTPSDQTRALERDFRRFVCQTSSDPLGIVIARARGSTVWDASGRKCLDLLAGMGVANVGHCNPEVVAAVCEQAERYLHVTVYGESVQAPQVELARRLADLAPGDLSVTYFTNSGTEAVEGALKIARKFTGRRDFVAFEGAFHGDTWGSMSVGGNPTYRRPFEPLLPGVRFLPFDDEGRLGEIDENVAAVIVEPVQAEGGVRIPGDAFLTALRARCDEVEALLVFDEVVTGLGRTGRWFACEHWGVVPDVIVLAKALGGGLPLGAFIGRREHMAILSHDPPLAPRDDLRRASAVVRRRSDRIALRRTRGSAGTGGSARRCLDRAPARINRPGAAGSARNRAAARPGIQRPRTRRRPSVAMPWRGVSS